jgi:hypothetical protein
MSEKEDFNQLEVIEQVMKLMSEYEIDCLEMDQFKITKSRHNGKPAKQIKTQKEDEKPVEVDDMFILEQPKRSFI